MSELRPIQQVKENASHFTQRIWTPDEKKKWQLKQIANTFNVKLSQVKTWQVEGMMPPSFSCKSCSFTTIWGDDDKGTLRCKRCKNCSRTRSGYRRAKRWKKLIIQEWLKQRELQPVKYKCMKFITLTVKNFIGQNLSDTEVKQIYMKPFRKYLKECQKRGWIIGGLYAYECTHKTTKQEQWFSGRNLTKPGQRIKTSENDSSIVVKEYHPHMHIISIGPRVGQSEHRQLWNECLNSATRSSPGTTRKGIVNTKVERQLSERVGGVHICAIDSVRKSLWYVVEYIKKSSLQGRNREPFGILRGAELDDSPVLTLS